MLGSHVHKRAEKEIENIERGNTTRATNKIEKRHNSVVCCSAHATSIRLVIIVRKQWQLLE